MGKLFEDVTNDLNKPRGLAIMSVKSNPVSRCLVYHPKIWSLSYDLHQPIAHIKPPHTQEKSSEFVKGSKFNNGYDRVFIQEIPNKVQSIMQELVGMDLIIGFFHFGGSGEASGIFVLPGDHGSCLFLKGLPVLLIKLLLILVSGFFPTPVIIPMINYFMSLGKFPPNINHFIIIEFITGSERGRAKNKNGESKRKEQSVWFIWRSHKEEVSYISNIPTKFVYLIPRSILPPCHSTPPTPGRFVKPTTPSHPAPVLINLQAQWMHSIPASTRSCETLQQTPAHLDTAVGQQNLLLLNKFLLPLLPPIPILCLPNPNPLMGPMALLLSILLRDSIYKFYTSPKASLQNFFTLISSNSYLHPLLTLFSYSYLNFEVNPDWKIGDKVWLNSGNISTTRLLCAQNYPRSLPYKKPEISTPFKITSYKKIKEQINQMCRADYSVHNHQELGKILLSPWIRQISRNSTISQAICNRTALDAVGWERIPN
ncbi:hypothetical protein VP01_5219g1 [Puccinia sorghi]|uniref:Uncharacterized protein n=1 Tax=Puccinia sorghi TaxID=27349 RepID=A0A0L6UKN3_9BASI|nr:hypothetical protein VP01_5219g1 [Puccinia sorghi]